MSTIKSITIGNDLETFYNNLNTVITNMFNSNLTVNVNRISETIYNIYIQNSSLQTIMDMYAVNLLPNDNNIETTQIVLCNNLIINNGVIDFSNITTSNIGPCFYTYNENNEITRNTYWINNTYSSSLNINTGNNDIDSIYKLLYTFSFNELYLPTNDYNEEQYLWLGFKSYQESNIMFFISKTNENNIGVFGVCEAIPTSSTTYTKSITTFSNTPTTININNLSIKSSIICLSNIIAAQSINHEYFPYLYYCVGQDNTENSYIQFESNGIEYYKILNGISAITSNPKFTIYQQIKYTINIFNANYYTLDSIKMIDNSVRITIDWGDGSVPTEMDSSTFIEKPTHNFTSGGTYTITISYSSLANPNLLYNIADTDKYTTIIDMSKAYQLTNLNVNNMFKFNTEEILESQLVDVKFPPNITSMDSNGLCENCLELNSITLPTENCQITGQWLYNSALTLNNRNSFTYPSNISFKKNLDNETNNFYTGNFSTNIIIDSNVECDDLVIGEYVTTLTINGNLVCNRIISDKNGDNEYNSSLTTLTIAGNCNANNIEICNLPNLTTLTFNSLNTTVIYNVNHLPNLTTLNISNSITSIMNISNCESLQTLDISENITNISINVGNYCDSLNEFNVSNDNLYYSSDNGILYNKDKTTLIRVPYGYTENINIPNTVTTIGDYALSILNTISRIDITSNIQTLNNNFMYHSNITTLNIDSNILSNCTFGDSTITNLLLGENVTELGTDTFSNVSINSLTVYDTDITLTTSQFNMNDLEVIFGYVASTAETFANDNNITFIPLSLGDNKTKYYITIPENNYTVSNVCTLSLSYSEIDWGDNTEVETVYNLETTLTHTYANSGNYIVTITHLAPNTIDFSYTSINTGLFAIATKLDFSELINCSTSISNCFNNLTGLLEIVYPPNVTAINNTLSNSNNVTSIALPNSLNNLQNSFNNENYNDLSSFSLPTTLTLLSNCFNNTNALLISNLTLNTTNTVSGLEISNSINSCSTVQSITIGDNVTTINNSLMNLLNVSLLTCNSNNSNYSSADNLLLNKLSTELIIVPGGLSVFTIPNTVTTLKQGSIANNKTYNQVIIPETVTNIVYPFYNSNTLETDTYYTTITELQALNPYSSMIDINKVITITDEQTQTNTYIDTANVTNIVGYEHSIIHSQINGYNRYPNCSTYNFTSLGYYNSNLVIGSNYTDSTFTNSQLLTISDTIINVFNQHYNYIVPNKNVYAKLNDLLTYVTTNTFDFVNDSNNYAYVIFYYVDNTNNLYKFIIYVFDIMETTNTIIIDDTNSTYNTRKITVDYDITNTEFTNLIDSGSFSTQSISTSSVDEYAVLTFRNIINILKADNTNITPTLLKYTTLIQVNEEITNTFNGYILGSNNTGTNKLFILDSNVRTDDYWLNVESNLIDADNIVNGLKVILDNEGNVDTETEITSIDENISELKLIRTDKYMFENNVELVSPIFELPNT